MRLLAPLFALLLAVPLRAQSPAQREQLEAFRDSLGSMGDSTVLIAQERSLITRASHEWRDSAMVHLRLGFLSLRLGDLAGKQHFEDAASEFQWAVDLQPKWPYPWLGLGLAELGVGDADFGPARGLQTALGKDALTRSANDFARSAEVDPSFVRGLVELSNTALRQRINLRLNVALNALRRAGRTPAGRQPEVLIARARVEREVGSPDSARAAIDSLIARGSPSSVALLEQARVRFRLGRLDGGEPWYRGLAIAEADAVAAYRSDVQFILPDSTLRAFDAATPAARVELMRRFWDLRDRDELHQPGQRLAEHYRRLDVAQHEYRLVSLRRHYDIVERYRPSALDFDDRGVIYIRQGVPDRRASVAQPGLPPNESWLYHRPNAPDLIFHFVAKESITDFRLIASVLDVLGYEPSLRLQGSGEVHDPTQAMPTTGNPRRPISADSAAGLRQRRTDMSSSRLAESLLQSRLELNPIYRRLLSSGRASATVLEADERAMGLASIRFGTTTDSWLPRFARPLDEILQFVGVSGDSSTPAVQVAWAIPVESVPAESRRRDGLFAPHVRVSIIGADGVPGPVVEAPVVPAAAQTIGGSQFFFGVVPIAAPGGLVTARVSIEAGGAGVVSNRDTVETGAIAGARWVLSDLALGDRHAAGWRVLPSGDTLWIDPAEQFPVGEPLQLYFEESGLAPGTPYRMELAVHRIEHRSFFGMIASIFGSGSTPFRLSVPGQVTRVRNPFSLELPHDLIVGQYQLEVTLSAAGEKRVRRQTITIVR